MSIATEIARLQAAKADIKAAIEAKGVTVPNWALIDAYPGYIGMIDDGKAEIRGLIEKTITTFEVPRGTTLITIYAFTQCGDLERITIPDSVTSIGASAFSRCPMLDNVELPDSVTSLGSSAFYLCTGMTRLRLSVGLVQLPSTMCQGCSSLGQITIPEGITRINSKAFDGCSELGAVTLLRTTPPTLANVDAFSGTPSTMKIYVPSASVNAYKSATNWNYYANIIEAIQTD